MLANVQRCWAVPFVPINFTVPCTGVLSSATHLVAYRWSAGEIVLPGQSFHQWTHLGKETSAHLGPLTAQGCRIINSWSKIMAEVLSLKQFLRVKTQRWYISYLDRSILLSARIKLLFAVVDYCCKSTFSCRGQMTFTVFVWSHHEQLLITVFSSWRASVKQLERPGPFHVSKVERGPLSWLLRWDFRSWAITECGKLFNFL